MRTASAFRQRQSPMRLDMRKLAMLIVVCIIAGGVVTACADKEPLDCENAIQWNEAHGHGGTQQTVVGPVVEIVPGNPPTPAFGADPASLFLGIPGPPEPPPAERTEPPPPWFAVRIGYGNLNNFQPDGIEAYEGKTVCIRGRISTLFDVAHIFVDSPEDIEVLD